ncbi:MAG: helix-turn-helix transcriptional regulator [Sphingomonadales bacterium]|nr:helix-turn-helix transcriptional regulator [Sphingomonadales bacterium]
MLLKNTVVLVDSLTAGRLKFKHYLSQPYRVLDFASADAAWSKILKSGPALLVHVLRGDGSMRWTLVRQIRSHSQLAYLPVLGIVESLDPVIREQSLEAGMDQLLETGCARDLLLKAAGRLMTGLESACQYSYRKFLFDDKLSQLPSEDERFLVKIHDYVRRNLPKADLQVGDMADAMAMSASQLDRRLYRLLGLTPKQYISEYRLCAAFQLLNSKQGNVSEVSAWTGFKSLSYFSTRFSERFRANPSVVRENRENRDYQAPWQEMAARLGISGPIQTPAKYFRKRS